MTTRFSLTPEQRIWTLVTGTAVVQGLLWLGVHVFGVIPHGLGMGLQIAVVWAAIFALAAGSTRRIGWLSRRLTQHEHAHLVTLDQVGQLEIQNALLTTLARSIDVGLAFQSLARQIARLVSCDRLGLALLKENSQEFQTYTARVTEEERRVRPRPDLEFAVDRTILGNVLRSREAQIVNDLQAFANDHLDANVLHSAGFRSALFLPLVAKNRAVGTLNLVSRARDAFVSEQVELLNPVTEILAVAILAQQWQVSLTRFRTMEAMAEVTHSVANEINGALQTIIGRCQIAEREHPDADLNRHLATVMQQAQRIAELLERMRHSTQERLLEMRTRVNEVEIPTSPEEIEEGPPQ